MYERRQDRRKGTTTAATTGNDSTTAGYNDRQKDARNAETTGKNGCKSIILSFLRLFVIKLWFDVVIMGLGLA